MFYLQFLLMSYWKSFLAKRDMGGGNFYIHTVDVIAAAKVVNLHTLLKYNNFPAENVDSGCPSCTEPANEDDLEMLNDHTVS